MNAQRGTYDFLKYIKNTKKKKKKKPTPQKKH